MKKFLVLKDLKDSEIVINTNTIAYFYSHLSMETDFKPYTVIHFLNETDKGVTFDIDYQVLKTYLGL